MFRSNTGKDAKNTALHNVVMDLQDSLRELSQARNTFNDSVINLTEEERSTGHKKKVELETAYNEAIIALNLGDNVTIKPAENRLPVLKQPYNMDPYEVPKESEGVSSYISTLEFKDANTKNSKELTPIDLFNIKFALINKLWETIKDYEFRKTYPLYTKFLLSEINTSSKKRIIHQLYSATDYSKERENFISKIEKLSDFYKPWTPLIYFINHNALKRGLKPDIKLEVARDGFKRKSQHE